MVRGVEGMPTHTPTLTGEATARASKVRSRAARVNSKVMMVTARVREGRSHLEVLALRRLRRDYGPSHASLALYNSHRPSPSSPTHTGLPTRPRQQVGGTPATPTYTP
ncbi:hypothetical protein Pcinc_028386 [Petrolisthes cinctipes]|uniref:Uncharacterized protein n=1 Tax=Petrolisthes cinctipes TaxID=88211 RepID=A0AAE1F263_PETCI|nr:hypothetical protein Pcinc_028386 [Petrolisthes cinctipes]